MIGYPRLRRHARPSRPSCRPSGLHVPEWCATRTAWTLLLAAADVAVTRAGGNTVAELAAVGLPGDARAVADRPRDHQTANARCPRAGRAAVLVPDAELDGDAWPGARTPARPSPTVWSPWAPRPRPWPAPTPPSGSPSWWRPTPVPEPRPSPSTGLPTGDCRSTSRRPGRSTWWRRRRRHAPDRQRAGRHGPSGVGQRPRGLRRRSSGCGRWASTSRSATTPPTSRRRRPRRRCRPRCPTATPRSSRPAARACRCCAAPRCSPPSPPRGARSPWPARTARPPRRRCWRSCSWRPACDPSFIIGGEVNEIGSGAVWDRRRVVRRRGRRERRHLRRAPAEAIVVTNVEADHLDYYGSVESLEAAFDRFLAGAPGPNLVCADDAVAAHARSSRTAPSPTAPPPTPTYRIVDSGSDRSAVRGSARGAHGERARAGRRCPLPGCTTPATRAPPWPWACWSASPFEAARGRAGPVRGRGPPLRVPRRGRRASPSSTTTPTSPARSRRPWPRPAPAAGDGSSAVFQPHRYSRTATLWHDFGDAFVDADVVVLTDVYAAGETPRPGVRQAGGRACSTPTRGSASGLLAASGGHHDVPAGGAAPRRPLPHPRRRRPDLAARRIAGPAAPGARRVTDPLQLADEILGARAGRDVPIGELTTYRVGGRGRALGAGSRPTTIWPPWARRCGPRRYRCS